MRGEETKVVLSHEELALLLEGVDLADTQRSLYQRDMTPVIGAQMSASLTCKLSDIGLSCLLSARGESPSIPLTESEQIVQLLEERLRLEPIKK